MQKYKIDCYGYGTASLDNCSQFVLKVIGKDDEYGGMLLALVVAVVCVCRLQKSPFGGGGCQIEGTCTFWAFLEALGFLSSWLAEAESFLPYRCCSSQHFDSTDRLQIFTCFVRLILGESSIHSSDILQRIKIHNL